MNLENWHHVSIDLGKYTKELEAYSRICTWLNEECKLNEWCHASAVPLTTEMSFWIKDKDLAILFKLTFA